MKRKSINKHFTLETRIIIEDSLNEGKNINQIALSLNRDRSNISREILKHRILKLPSNYGNTSTCINKDNCNKRKYNCDASCTDYVMSICDKLKASPHVCNTCNTKGCRKAKYYYKAQEANTQYLQTLNSSRKNLHYSELELSVLNTDFYYLVIQNKSVYHSITLLNKEGYNFNIKSIYRQIKNNRLKLKSSDLPRYRKKTSTKNVDTSYKRDIKGHTFEDFKKLIETNIDLIQWEIDCVQGIVGADEQVFLTLEIVKIKFLFIFILSHQTFNEVKHKLSYLKKALDMDKDNCSIDILLSDNGHEFIKLDELIEVLNTNNIFYCHPYSSFEKGELENNHELIRRVIPKGISLSIYSEKDIQLLCSHINSLYRKELDGKCSFDLVYDYLSVSTLDLLGYKQIKPRDVKLIPELLGEKNVANIKKYLDKKEIEKANIKFIEKD